MRLNAPRVLFFILSVVIALVGLAAQFISGFNLPIDTFWVMTIAYVILALACVITGA